MIAYGETMDQKSYYVSSVADQVFCHPNGGIEWDGFSVTLFMKGLLDKLGIETRSILWQVNSKVQQNLSELQR